MLSSGVSVFYFISTNYDLYDALNSYSLIYFTVLNFRIQS